MKGDEDKRWRGGGLGENRMKKFIGKIYVMELKWSVIMVRELEDLI